MRRIILGLGSGRCGSYSLHYLLNLQKDSYFTHENHSVPFEMDEKRGVSEIVRMLLKPESIVGDVAYYWLNYVPFMIPFVGEIKFICLKRDQAETVESFCKKKISRNFMVKESSKHFVEEDKKYGLDGTNFPAYDLPKKEAVGKYWEEYYQLAEHWQNSYPYNFGVFDINDLNSEAGQKKILSFAEFEEPRICISKPMNTAKSLILETKPVEMRMRAYFKTKCGICRGDATKHLVSKNQSLSMHICNDCMEISIQNMLYKCNLTDYTLLERSHV